MGDDRGGRIATVAVQKDFDLVLRQYLQCRHPGGFGESVCIDTEIQGAKNPFFMTNRADRLGHRQDVHLIETCLQRGAAMSRGAESHSLPWIGRVRRQREIGAHQSGHVGEQVFGGGFASQGVKVHRGLRGLGPSAAAALPKGVRPRSRAKHAEALRSVGQ